MLLPTKALPPVVGERDTQIVSLFLSLSLSLYLVSLPRPQHSEMSKRGRTPTGVAPTEAAEA